MKNIITDSVTRYRRIAISILLAAQIVSLEVVNNLFVDDGLKEFADDTQVADGSILRQR